MAARILAAIPIQEIEMGVDIKLDQPKHEKTEGWLRSHMLILTYCSVASRSFGSRGPMKLSSFEEIKLTEQQKMAVDEDTLNRLYYQAKNLAIENMLRKVEQMFKPRGFEVQAYFVEDCRYSLIELLIHHKGKSSPELRQIQLKREHVSPLLRPSCISPIDHHVDSIQTGAHYPHRKPKVMEQFDAMLSDPTTQFALEALVRNCNYPFLYQSYSSI